jgi:glycosyltransferase involved in cell wall biosynthesis
MTRHLSVGILDTEYYTYNHYIPLAVAAAFGRDPRVVRARMIYIHRAEDDLRQGDIDLLVVIGNAANVHWLVKRWKARGVTTVFWSTEDPYQIDDNLAYSKDYDLVFTNDLAAVPMYLGRARHLPLAASLDNHDLPVLDEAALTNDILFIGSAWPNRVEAVNEIVASLDRSVRMKVALAVNPHIPKPKIASDSMIWRWRTSPNGFARLANRAKVVLTLGRTYSGVTGQVFGSTPPPRIFEIGAAGTAQVFVASSREIDRYYEDGKDLITVPSLPEAIEQIQKLLDDPAARQEMAQSMRRATLAEHTYDDRIGDILEAVLAHREAAETKAAARSVAPAPATRRPRLMIVAHNTIDKAPGGGVEVYLHNALRYLRQRYDVFILTPETHDDRLILDLVRPDGVSVRHETLHRPSTEHSSMPQVEDFFFKTLVRNQIDLVHFHHLLHLPLSLPHVAKLAGAKTLYTVHDFYLICQNFTLISHEGKFCNFLEKSESFCDICLRNTHGKPAGTQAIRRNAIQRTLPRFDRIVFNTPYSENMFRKTYRLAEGQATIIEMAMPENVCFTAPEEKKTSTPKADGEIEPLKVMVPGNFTREKGAPLLLHVMELMRDDPVEFHILGREDSRLGRQLDAANNPRIQRRRGYQQHELHSLLLKGDVSLNFSVWPETYMISLSEAWNAGLVPIVSDLGAPEERVVHGETGFVVPHDDPARIADHIRELAFNRDTLERMQANIAHLSVRRMREAVDDLVACYQELIGAEDPVDIGDMGEAQIIFDRLMYAERFTNNSWADTGVAWDGAYATAHIHLAPARNEIPVAPTTDLPAVYQHLRVERRERSLRRDVRFVSREKEPISMGVQHTRLSFRINTDDAELNVRNFLKVTTPGVDMYYPAESLDKDPNGFVIASRIPSLHDIKGLSVVAIYDGFAIEYAGLEDKALSAQPAAEPTATADRAKTRHIVPAAWTSTLAPLEGCDRMISAKISGNSLVVTGWGFDPISGEIPSEAAVMLRLPDGTVSVAEAKRSSDSEITQYEPIYGFSGLTCALPISEISAALGEQLDSFTVAWAQKAPQGWITSGTALRLDIDALFAHEGEMTFTKVVEADVVAPISDAVEDCGISGESAQHIAEELVWTVDPRLFRERAKSKGRLTPETLSHLICEYITHGEKLGDRPTVYFDPKIYMESNPELADQKLLLTHYLQFGRREGRKAGLAPIKLTPEAEIVRDHLEVDFYLGQAFGGAAFSGDPALHYLAFGEENGLRPTRNFDPIFYLQANPDVAAQDISAFFHYLKYGKAEGRRPSETSSIYSHHRLKRRIVEKHFEVDFYINHVPYIQNTDVDPICHYFEHGIPNGIMPNKKYASVRSRLPEADEAERFINWCLANAVDGETA